MDLVPSVSNESEASTSVETRPGTTLRISLPNSTSCWRGAGVRKSARSEETERGSARGGRWCSRPARRRHCGRVRCASASGCERVQGGEREDAPALLLGVLDGDVDEAGVLGLLDGGEDERGVGGGVLGLVDGDRCTVRRRRGRVRMAVARSELDRGRTTEAERERERERELVDAHSKSPESETTVVYFLSCSRVLDMTAGSVGGGRGEEGRRGASASEPHRSRASSIRSAATVNRTGPTGRGGRVVLSSECAGLTCAR